MANITQLPTTQFSGLDYNNVMNDIVTLVTENPTYNKNWDDFLSSNAGRMMIELFAYIADQLSIRVDWFANENFIATATQDSSVLNLLKLIHYKLSLAISASVDITLNFNNPLVSQTVILTPTYVPFSLRKGTNSFYNLTALDKNGISKNFELINYDAINGFDYISSVQIASSYNNPISTTDLTFYEGTTKTTTFTSLNDDNPHFVLPDTSIIDNSIKVYLITSSNNGQTELELLKVENFLDPSSFDTTKPVPYVINVIDVGKAEIEFAPSSILADPSRRFPKGSTIEVFYRVGGGVDGNISIKSINVNTILQDIVGNQYTINLSNLTAGQGGIDAETIEHARINGPLSIATTLKTVTIDDYNTILKEYGSCLLSKTYGFTNLPSNFYDLYKKNPDSNEVINYVLLNKNNYNNVPASEYNNFKWINTYLENRFNEIYSFSQGSFNIQNSFSSQALIPSITNVLATYGSTTTENFYNVFPIYISQDYINTIVLNGTFNTSLKVKFSSNEVQTTFFSSINVSNNFATQWLDIPTVVGITTDIGTNSYIGPLSATTYYVSVDDVDYPVIFGSNGRGNGSTLTFNQVANFINTSLNSTFSGSTSNLNDLMIIGEVPVTTEYTITISSSGTPDSFIWQKNGVFSSPILITSSPIIIDNTFTIQFLNTTGHTVGNMWAVKPDKIAFCSWEINPDTNKYDMSFYTYSKNAYFKVSTGATPDLLYAIYNITYPALTPVVVEDPDINGMGFIDGTYTKTGIGYINNSLVIQDVQNCSAEWIATVPVVPNTIQSVYGFDTSVKNSIGINIDGRGMVTIPLNSDYSSSDQKLIFLSNPSPLSISGYTPGSQNVAQYHYGIVEKINQYLSLNTGSYGSQAVSLQWLGLDTVLGVYPTQNSVSTGFSTPNNYTFKITENSSTTTFTVPIGTLGRTSYYYSSLVGYINTSMNLYSYTNSLGNTSVLNDLLINGTINSSSYYTFQIMKTGSPDIYRWKKGMNDVVIVGGTSYQVYDDLNSTWGTVTSLATTLSAVGMDGKKTIIIGNSTGSISVSSNGGTSFGTLTAISTWGTSISGIATDGLNNWVVCSTAGKYAYSNNNGTSWTTGIISGWTGKDLTAVYCDGIYWVFGSNTGEIAYVLNSSSVGGLFNTPSWNTYNLGWSQIITNIKSDNNGYWLITGKNAKVAYNNTQNALNAWTTASLTWTGDINSIATDGFGTWIIVGASGQQSISTNRTSWSTSTISGLGAITLNKIYTGGNGKWYIIGSSGTAYYSVNSGSSWTTLGLVGWSTTNLIGLHVNSSWNVANISVSPTLLPNSISTEINVNFLNTTGHTQGDTWYIKNTSPYFCSWAPKGGSSGNWDIKFYNAPGNIYTISVSGGTTNDLLLPLYNNNSYAGKMPLPISGGDYSSVASVVSLSSGYEYLKITSPSTGISSTIQFITSDFQQNLSNSIEFMDVLGVKYTGNISGISTGQKKITLVTNPSDPYYYGYAMYEHNSISYPSFYPQNIYMHYTAQEKNSIILGSVYNNFYYTGNSTVDAQYKNSINKIYNSNVYAGDTVNVEASDIKLAFTSKAVTAKTIEAIQSDSSALDIYPMEYMKIPSADLHSINNTTFSINDYLMFSIDSGSKITIALNGISSFDSLYTAISNAIQSNYGVTTTTITRYLEKDTSNSYILWLKSYAKNPTGNITFYRKPVSNDYANNHALSKIFGNPLTVSSDPVSYLNFGDLYFSDGTFNKYNVGFDLATGTWNESGITLYHDALPFIYCFIDPKTKTVRYPDYYLSYEKVTTTFTGNGIYPNDLTFTGTINNTYTITIDSLGTPDTFTWSEDGITSNSINVATTVPTIFNGSDIFDISFAHTTGHYIGDTWTITPSNNYFMNRNTSNVNNKLPTGNFYLHLINDRTGETIDETYLQSYLDKFRMTGIKNTIYQPLFSTFDFVATIYYNSFYSISTIKNNVYTTLQTNYGITNASIGNSISRSNIVFDIQNIQGVSSVEVDYFGKDYTDSTTNVINTLTARFDEIIVLSEDKYSTSSTLTHGLILTYIPVS